jgi:peptidoglycan LD-endopeptidase LytH
MELVERQKVAGIGGLFKIIVIIGLPSFIMLILIAIGILAAIVTNNQNSGEGIVGGEPSTTAKQMIPPQYIPVYKAAEKAYGVPWNLLAAHHKVETNFSRIPKMVSYVGAIGPYQFMPKTWIGWGWKGGTRLGNANIPPHILTDPVQIKKYGGFGVDGNKDGKADPWDLVDAVFSAANYLAANGAANGQIEKAVFAYNHSQEYVNKVLEYANSFANMNIQQPSKVSASGLVWPVPFTHNITSPFGMRFHPIKKVNKLHNGIDIAAAGINGQKVVSVAPGRVKYAGFIGGYGNSVIVQHEGNFESQYAHLSSITVKKGQPIQSGETLGTVGSTGLSTGPHLHLIFKRSGIEFDPMSLLK